MKMGILLLLIVVISIVLNITAVEGKNHLTSNLTRDTSSFKYIDVDSQLTFKNYDDNLSLEIIDNNKGIFNITSTTEYNFVGNVSETKKWAYRSAGSEFVNVYSNLSTALIIKPQNGYSLLCRTKPSKITTLGGIPISADYHCLNYTHTLLKSLELITNYSSQADFFARYDPDPVVVTINLTIFLPFNETTGSNAQDHSPSDPDDNNATLQGGAQLNGKLVLDGVNDWAQAANTDLNLTAGTDITFCAVVVTNDTSWNNPQRQRIVEAFNSGYHFSINPDGKFQASFFGCGGKISINPIFFNNTETHVCAAFDNSNNSITLYHNGTSIDGSGGCNDDGARTITRHNIGTRDNGNDRDLSGNISKYRLWQGIVLNSSQINDVYQVDFNVGAPPADDNTCIDAYTSGDFVVECSQLCVGNATLDIGTNNFILNGQGNYSIEANMTVGDVIQDKQCQIILNKKFNFDFTK